MYEHDIQYIIREYIQHEKKFSDFRGSSSYGFCEKLSLKFLKT